MGGDLSLGSLENAEVYFFVSWARIALETALLMSTESSSWERVIWPEPEAGDLSNILMGEGRKVSAEETGEKEGEFVSVIKFDTMGVMSEY